MAACSRYAASAQPWNRSSSGSSVMRLSPPLPRRRSGFLEDRQRVVQAGDEAAAVDLLAAAGTVAEPDDVGAALRQPGRERQPLGVVGEGDEPIAAVAVVAHQDGQLAARYERPGAV